MTYQLALFGHPVKHSLSPQIHQEFARQFGLDIDYQLIDVTTDELHRRVHQFFDQGGHGANITVPHKQAVMAVTDQLTKRAQKSGAVNTLFIKDHQLWGDNTDGEGFINDLLDKNISPQDKRILIIGAGGAVQGIVPSLLKTQPGSIHILNRTQYKAQQLVATSPLCYMYKDSPNCPPFDVIINGTSSGHNGHSPDLKSAWVSPKTIAYDLSYGHAALPFLHKIRLLGSHRTHNGLGMLHQQAALAFKRWFNYSPVINMYEY